MLHGVPLVHGAASLKVEKAQVGAVQKGSGEPQE